MTAQILDGREVAAAIRAEVSERVRKLADRGKGVGLATVLVGDDPASHIYVRNKRRLAGKLGITSIHHELAASTEARELDALIASLNENPEVDAMLVQFPLPGHLDETDVMSSIGPDKDADGLHPHNLGLLTAGRPFLVPNTPAGVLRILRHFDIATQGHRAVVVGRSVLVGRPLALLLGAKGVDATVTTTHSRTPDLASVTREADILVAAAGVPHLIGADHVKPGAVVVDVGINRENDRFVGDVDFEAVSELAASITPVPGGVGPVTVASLMSNAVTAAEGRVR